MFLFAGIVALALAAGSSASPKPASLGPPAYVVGATEDLALGDNDGGAAAYDQMKEYGLGAIRMSVDYDPSQPTIVQGEGALRRAIAPAVARGIRILLSIAPEHSTDVTGQPDGVARFAAYTALVARAFPSVTDFIVGNEPNLGRFWFPTFAADGSVASGRTYEAALAASYDALKAVNPAIDVIGLAVSPRGDDRPGSSRNTVSPVRFIQAVGAAYRASGRVLPLMDNVALHPYPNVNTDPPDKGYSWPNAGVPNLDRAQQAFWDAFNGTGQPTFREDDAPSRWPLALPASVRWILDEAGWQTNTQNIVGYTGAENVPVVTEATQAAYHAEVVRKFACDPHVAALLFFHWVDETDRDRFQTGALRADETTKPSAVAVRNAIAAGCTDATVTWHHSTTVDGATAYGPSQRGFLFFVKANEDATFVATATPRSGGARPSTVAGTVKAYLGRGVRFPGITPQTMSGFKYTTVLAATMNPERTTTLKLSPS